jgi:hypothetical protein
MMEGSMSRAILLSHDNAEEGSSSSTDGAKEVGFLLLSEGDQQVSVEAFNHRFGRLDKTFIAEKVLGIKQIRNKNISGILTLDIAVFVRFGYKRDDTQCAEFREANAAYRARHPWEFPSI